MSMRAATPFRGPSPGSKNGKGLSRLPMRLRCADLARLTRRESYRCSQPSARALRRPLHMAMDIRLACHGEAVSPVQRANRVPLEIFQTGRKHGAIGRLQTMLQHPAAESIPLLRRQKIELPKAHEALLFPKRDGSDKPPLALNRKKRLVLEVARVHRTLVLVVPSPSLPDVALHGGALHVKGEREMLRCLLQSREAKIGS